MNEEKLKKHQTIPFVDISTDGTADWARIGYSTIFDLVLNANIITNDYIKDEAPTDEVTSYKPTLSQELQTIKGDKAFDSLYDMLYTLPTGEGIKRDVLLVFAGNIGDESAPVFRAWKVKASVILTNFNTVEEKILFDISFGGTIERGTATVTDGKPVFTLGEMVTVTFDSNGGTPVASQTIKAGTTVTEPTEPSFEGHTFKGWFVKGQEQSFDFAAPVNKNISLYADWTEATV